MMLALLIAGGWTGLSLAALPLAARLIRPVPVCRDATRQGCQPSSASRAVETSPNAAHTMAPPPVAQPVSVHVACLDD